MLHSCTVDTGSRVLLKDTSTRAGIEPPTPWFKDGPADLWHTVARLRICSVLHSRSKTGLTLSEWMKYGLKRPFDFHTSTCSELKYSHIHRPIRWRRQNSPKWTVAPLNSSSYRQHRFCHLDFTDERRGSSPSEDDPITDENILRENINI